MREWKLLMNPDRSRVELYNIPDDPMEVNNQASQESNTVSILANRLTTWHHELPAGGCSDRSEISLRLNLSKPTMILWKLQP